MLSQPYLQFLLFLLLKLVRLSSHTVARVLSNELILDKPRLRSLFPLFKHFQSWFVGRLFAPSFHLRVFCLLFLPFTALLVPGRLSEIIYLRFSPPCSRVEIEWTERLLLRFPSIPPPLL
jgi:hypothetical protein